jgi:dihydroxyacetone kinase-like protein
MSEVRGTVKKLINDPAAAVDEMLEAFTAAHSDLVVLGAPHVVERSRPASSKVGVAIGGGSGHEPAFLGYVGVGMADTAAVGNVFAAPSADIVLESIRRANHGIGVVLLYGNYTGDRLNCRRAVQRAAADGIDVRSVFVSDDLASASRDEIDKRRGIAGDIIVFKITGAAAESGMTLEEVERLARTANSNTSSMGIALTGAEIPGAAEPIFECGSNEMEVGLGVHGEPGVSREPLRSASAVGRLLAERVLADLRCPTGSRVAVLVNGLGSTPLMEQYLVYGSVRDLLTERGIRIERSFVGEFITSLQMAGLSVTVTVLDDELLRLLDAPARTVAFVQ